MILQYLQQSAIWISKFQTIILNQANTASYLIDNCSNFIIVFVSMSVHILIKFDLNEINKSIFYSFGLFMKLLIAHSCKFKNEWYRNMKQFHANYESDFVVDVLILIQRILNVKYLVNNDSKFCKRHIILPLIIFMKIFEDHQILCLCTIYFLQYFCGINGYLRNYFLKWILR